MSVAAELVVGRFLAAAIRVATPLLLAATGELIAERSGVIDLGIEGGMLAGALAAAIGSAALGPWAGLAAGLAAGVALALIFALVAIGAGADQIIAGTALTLRGRRAHRCGVPSGVRRRRGGVDDSDARRGAAGSAGVAAARGRGAVRRAGDDVSGDRGGPDHGVVALPHAQRSRASGRG